MTPVINCGHRAMSPYSKARDSRTELGEEGENDTCSMERNRNSWEKNRKKKKQKKKQKKKKIK